MLKASLVLYIVSLYTKLIEELKDQVPNNLTFAIGYFEGQKYSKVSTSLARATPVREKRGLVIVLYTSHSNGMQLALAHQFPTSP